jgi:hypothetical protein
MSVASLHLHPKEVSIYCAVEHLVTSRAAKPVTSTQRIENLTYTR